MKKYFKTWWIPIISYLIPILIFLIGILFKSDLIIDISLAIFYLNILCTIISSVVQIVMKKWYFIIPQLLISFLLFCCISFIFTFTPPDYYGVYKRIPENIEIYEPLGKEPINEGYKINDLFLISSFQPGIYEYYTNFQPTKLGSLYIKAYEITSNDKLSETEIKESSKISIENLDTMLYSGRFTIYEGSWGDKYGARIELWFDPKNGEEEYKITEKNYIIEGWMR